VTMAPGVNAVIQLPLWRLPFETRWRQRPISPILRLTWTDPHKLRRWQQIWIPRKADPHEQGSGQARALATYRTVKRSDGSANAISTICRDRRSKAFAMAGYFAAQSSPDRVGACSRRSRGAHGSPPIRASPIRVRSGSAPTVAKTSARCRVARTPPEAAILVLRALVRMLRMYVC
jgi:hypothetical protein